MSMFCQIGPRIVLARAERRADVRSTDEVAPSERPQSPASPRPVSLDTRPGMTEIEAKRRTDVDLVAPAEAQR